MGQRGSRYKNPEHVSSISLSFIHNGAESSIRVVLQGPVINKNEKEKKKLSN